MSASGSLKIAFYLLAFMNWMPAVFADIRWQAQDYEAIEWAVHDLPFDILAKAEDKLKTINKDQFPEEWLLAKWTVIYVNVTHQLAGMSAPRFLDEIVSLSKFAKQMHLEKFALDLELLAFDLSEGDLPQETVTAKYSKLIDRASELKLKDLKIQVSLAMEQYLRLQGSLGEANQLWSKILSEIQGPQEVSAFTKILVQNRLAVRFKNEGQAARALEILYEVDRLCHAKPLRAFHSIVKYNIANHLRNKGSPEDLKEAERYLIEAVDMASSSKSASAEGVARVGLARVQLEFGRIKEALANTERAARIFEDLGNNIWHAESLKLMGLVHQKGKEHQKAIQFFQDSLKFFSEDFKDDQEQLHSYMAESYHALKLDSLAYENLLITLKFVRLIAKERSDKIRNEVMSKLGLQFEEEKNRNLKEELQDAQRFRLLMVIFFILAVVIIVLLSIAFLKSRQARIVQLKMKAILENIDEGIVLIDSELRIGSTYSLHLHEMMQDPTSFAQASFVERILRQFAGEKDQEDLIEQVLRSLINEKSLAWHLNEANLPRELKTKKDQRIFALNWVPIINGDDQVILVLLSLRDITARRQLEIEVDAERKQAKGRAEILAELMKADLAASHRLILSLIQAHDECRTDVIQLRRDLHTAKGVARTLGLKILSSLIHDWETELQTEDKNFDVICQKDRPILDSYLQLCLFGLQPTQADSVSLLTLTGKLQRSLQEQARAGGLAHLNLQVSDDWGNWDAATLDLLNEILPHLLSNCLDHGYILARTADSPPITAHIELHASAIDNRLRLAVADKGVGLNIPKLTELAQKINFIPQSGESIAHVIFQDGISTAAKASATSGRGIGLAAVKAKVESVGGHIAVESGIDAGTRFVMTF